MVGGGGRDNGGHLRAWRVGAGRGGGGHLHCCTGSGHEGRWRALRRAEGLRENAKDKGKGVRGVGAASWDRVSHSFFFNFCLDFSSVTSFRIYTIKNERIEYNSHLYYKGWKNRIQFSPTLIHPSLLQNISLRSTWKD